jgi:hypothetical protein
MAPPAPAESETSSNDQATEQATIATPGTGTTGDFVAGPPKTTTTSSHQHSKTTKAFFRKIEFSDESPLSLHQ